MDTRLPAEPADAQAARLSTVEMPPGFLVPPDELAAAVARFGIDTPPPV